MRAEGWGWRHAGRKAWAVRGLDLHVEAGERVLLLGASGAGKSTLLAGLAGLLDPDETGEQEGRLLLDGVPARQARRDGVIGGRPRTGLLLQDPLAQTVLARCGDDVAFGLENHAVPPAQIWPRVAQALDGVRFPYPPSRSTAALSGGERQRLALAGVLALSPGLLLLDEPTALLDPDGATVLRAEVARVLAATGATCVLVEHRIAPWLDLIDRVVVIEPGGGALADSSPAEVLGEHGAELAARGVWVPGHLPQRSRPPGAGTGEELVVARDLAVAPAARSSGRRGRRRATAPAVVSGVDLALRAGSATSVLGPNGAGKSSLAMAVAGLVPPVAGSVTASDPLAAGAGPYPHAWRPRELVTRIGTVFQEPQHQFVAATVEQELAVGPDRVGVPAAQARGRIDALLQRLRLDRLARANPFTLSGGEQRRLSVATVLATEPRVLVLDEPTFGQDSRTWAELVDLLGELLDGGAALLAVTHDEPLVVALGGTVLRLESRDSRDTGRDVPDGRDTGRDDGRPTPAPAEPLP